MNAITSLRTVNDDFQVEYEVLSPIDISTITDPNRREIALSLQDVDKQINFCEEEIAKLSTEIDKLTNHADGIDYAVAVAIGILTGLIDSFFVGETEIDKEKIQELLEKKYHTANDSGYKHKGVDGHWVSSAMYHRLDDLAHHPSVGGLVASILVRYFRLVVFIDGSDGKPHIFFADTSSPEDTALEKEEQTSAWIGAIIGGLCIWLSNLAIQEYEKLNCEELPEPFKKLIKVVGASPMMLEILKTVDVWVGHMMSDVSTSQGIPGVFLSLLKEISVLPIIRNTDFRVWVDGLYNNGKMNLSEWGGVAFVAAKKQSLPVLINEVLVRSLFFVKYLAEELKEKKDFKQVDWKKTIPFGNRTVERMMTVASGTFTAVDIADAAIRSGGFNAACLLRVNFVDIGRFAIAIGVDVGMGIKRYRLRNERIDTYNQLLMLYGAKVYYLEAGMWCSAINTGKTIEKTVEIAEESIANFAQSWQNIEEDMQIVGEEVANIVYSDPDFAQEILDELDY